MLSDFIRGSDPKPIFWVKGIKLWNKLPLRAMAVDNGPGRAGADSWQPHRGCGGLLSASPSVLPI